jgi:hypothetical protein
VLKRPATLVVAALGLIAFPSGVTAYGAMANSSKAGSACYSDAIGDAGDAPDIARVTIRPSGAALTVDVTLAKPTELGPYGWILVGFDTDRNAATGGGRGDELLTFTSGDGTTLTRWVDGRFTSDFVHGGFHWALTPTLLTITIPRADLHAASFDFAVASLRQQSDLAPGAGVAPYPARASSSHGNAGDCPAKPWVHRVATPTPNASRRRTPAAAISALVDAEQANRKFEKAIVAPRPRERKEP